jgi:hypothetical protein
LISMYNVNDNHSHILFVNTGIKIASTNYIYLN